MILGEEHPRCLHHPHGCFGAQLGLFAPSHGSALVLGTPRAVLAVSQKPWRPKGDIQSAKLHGLREGRENTSELRGDHVTVMH